MMVAYSFKERFIAPIEAGLNPGEWRSGMKRQTIRANRRRHARSGERLQLYYAQRTIHCRLIGVPRCTAVRAIVLRFRPKPMIIIDGRPLHQDQDAGACRAMALDGFARRDGFSSWEEMVAFWFAEHGFLDYFEGVLIEWTPHKQEEASL